MVWSMAAETKGHSGRMIQSMSSHAFRSARRYAAIQRKDSAMLELKLEVATLKWELQQWWEWWCLPLEKGCMDEVQEYLPTVVKEGAHVSSVEGGRAENAQVECSCSDSHGGTSLNDNGSKLESAILASLSGGIQNPAKRALRDTSSAECLPDIVPFQIGECNVAPEKPVAKIGVSCATKVENCHVEEQLNASMDPQSCSSAATSSTQQLVRVDELEACKLSLKQAGPSSESFVELLEKLEATEITHVSFYDSAHTMVLHTGSKTSSVDVPREALPLVLEYFRKKQIATTSYLDRKFITSSASTSFSLSSAMETQERECETGRVAELNGTAGEQEDSDVPEFSHAQLTYIVDMTINSFAESVAQKAPSAEISRDVFHNVSVMFKDALPADTAKGTDEPMFSRRQITKVISMISEECSKVLASKFHIPELTNTM